MLCACGKEVRRVWPVYHLVPDDRPFGSGIPDRVPCGHMGDCGEIKESFQVFPRRGNTQCKPVEVAEVPANVEVLSESYEVHQVPQIDNQLLTVLSKLQITIQSGTLVLDLPSNGKVPDQAIPVELPPEGCQIAVSNLNLLKVQA